MKKYQMLLICCALIFLSSCEKEEKENFSEYEVDLNSNYRVLIISKVTKTEYRGVITKIDYGSTINTTYTLKIKHKNRTMINSDLGSEEPKHLLICPDDIWLHIVGEYYRKQEKVAAADKVKINDDKPQEAADEYVLEIGARYKKLKDERYFFHLVGDIFWVDEEAKTYNEKLSNNACVEYPLPGAHLYKDIR